MAEMLVEKDTYCNFCGEEDAILVCFEGTCKMICDNCSLGIFKEQFEEHLLIKEARQRIGKE